MIVAHSLSEAGYDANSIVTIGTFDGVHLGHRSIIQAVVERARAKNARSLVITFDPHPREIVGRGPVKLLTTLQERLAVIESLGIEVALVLPFTYEFSRQSSEEFYDRYVIKGAGVREVVEGYDHMFGRDREANIEKLRAMGQEYGFLVVAVSPVVVGGDVVSSSMIREALMRGEVDRAERFLDRPYSLQGIVVKGDGRGAQLGFPTANIQPESDKKVIPAEGVYFASVGNGELMHFGMLNIGVRPTFSSTLTRVIEAHLFDVQEDLYGKRLTIHFLKRLRREKKFSSKEELIAQLQHDRDECMKHIEALQL